jgi:hypothetical protein
MAMTASTGDVKANRERVVRRIDDALKATAALAPPSVGTAEWSAAVAALTAARPILAEPMTKAEYKAAIEALADAPQDFDDLCKTAIRWVKDNLPH